MTSREITSKLIAVAVFVIAFAWVESAVVVYLRDIYYPAGFEFPLKQIDDSHIALELVREFATLVMLGAVATIAGTSRWTRFGFFSIAFGVWDIFFYVWLKVMIDWPASIFDWDILFLLPLPWIGPVIAPVIISIVLVAAGLMILRIEQERPFRASPTAWFLAIMASIIVLGTFMRDMAAGLSGAMPAPFPYAVFGLGVALYVAAMTMCWRAFRQEGVSGT